MKPENFEKARKLESKLKSIDYAIGVCSGNENEPPHLSISDVLVANTHQEWQHVDKSNLIAIRKVFQTAFLGLLMQERQGLLKEIQEL